jgi:hypothetical protein
MSTALKPIPLAGSSLDEYRHVCTFFSSPAEEHSILMPFIRDGLSRGARALHVVDPEHDHLERLRDEGIDVEGTQETGQLEVRNWEQAHLTDGQFQQRTMLELAAAPSM